jgi:hypothetical protein
MTIVASTSLLTDIYASSGPINLNSYIINFLNNTTLDNYEAMLTKINSWFTDNYILKATGIPYVDLSNNQGFKFQIIDMDGVQVYDSKMTNTLGVINYEDYDPNADAKLPIINTVRANNFTNYLNQTISTPTTSGQWYIPPDNKMTRINNIGAAFSPSGVYFVNKYSNSAGKNVLYMSVRLGDSPLNPIGIVSLSMFSSS